MLEKIEITFINQYAGGMSDGLCHQFRWRVRIIRYIRSYANREISHCGVSGESIVDILLLRESVYSRLYQSSFTDNLKIFPQFSNYR